jgi:protocatechuate 3,4-dioxygenase beta subunit
MRSVLRTTMTGFSVLALVLAARGQVNVTTYHNDNARTGQNTKETMLTPANVNVNQFGKLFTQPVDGMIVGQPLYLSNVSIPGAGTHNVVYVATQHDSVYAFDADNNQGANAAPLWKTSFINPSAGITSVPIADQSCGNVTRFTEIGIVATPVIDPATGTLYVIAKTEEAGTFVHRLHALDVTTGQEKLGGPVTITASVSVSNQVVTFDDRHQMARPGLLLANGVVYVAFGSVGCKNFAPAQGWLMAYDATALRQLGVFNTNPDQNFGASIWQSGAGPASDGSNIYVVTADGLFDGNIDFGDSMLKLNLSSQGLSLIDYFTPFNQSSLQAADLDLGSSGVLLLPDQAGLHPHLLLSGGKEGKAYLVDRDNMGKFNPTADQVVQTLPSTGSQLRGVSGYWNNEVYIAQDQGYGVIPPNTQFISAYQLSGGQLSTLPVSQAQVSFATGPPSISAKGTIQGILWAVRIGTTNALYAFDAANLANNLYNSLQSSPRDDLGVVAHFAVPTVAKGKVYVGGTQQLNVYGLFSILSPVGGNNQSSLVATSLPTALTVRATNFSGPLSGVPITFTDGGRGGTFSKKFVKTDSTGSASSTYTNPTKSGIVNITAVSPNFAQATFTETAIPGTATALVAASGSNQRARVTRALPLLVVAKALDVYGNGVPGVAVSFADQGTGGSFSPASVITDSAGKAKTSYTTSTNVGAVVLTASSTGLTQVSFSETVTAGPVSTIALTSGNNQSATAGTQFSQSLVVTLADQYGNPVSGVSVSFSDNGAGGSFSANPVSSNSNGRATVNYTASTKAGNVSVTASATGVSSVSFAEAVIAASASTLTIILGNNQSGAPGSTLPTQLVVQVTDPYGNSVSGTAVSFSDNNAGGNFSINPVGSDINGLASVAYTLPIAAGPVTVTAAAPGVSSVSFNESVTPASAAILNKISGDGQTGSVNSPLPLPLVVQVTDQYGNPVSGVAVTFDDGGMSGTFSNNPIVTDNSGFASVVYTPQASGSIAITASIPSVPSVTPAVFSETVQ